MMHLLRAGFVGGTRSEPFYGIEVIAPSLSLMRSLFRAGDQAKKLAKMNDEG